MESELKSKEQLCKELWKRKGGCFNCRWHGAKYCPDVEKQYIDQSKPAKKETFQTGKIRIETEKVWVGEVKSRRILSVECLRARDLPLEYLQGQPSCRGFDNLGAGIFFQPRTRELTWLDKGEIYPEETFQAVWKVLQAAGERLHQINLEKEWSGTETFET